MDYKEFKKQAVDSYRNPIGHGIELHAVKQRANAPTWTFPTVADRDRDHDFDKHFITDTKLGAETKSRAAESMLAGNGDWSPFTRSYSPSYMWAMKNLEDKGSPDLLYNAQQQLNQDFRLDKADRYRHINVIQDVPRGFLQPRTNAVQTTKQDTVNIRNEVTPSNKPATSAGHSSESNEGVSRSVIPSDLLNNDAVKRNKDPEQMRKYLEIMLPVAGGMQQLVSGGDFSVDAVLTNDVAIDGFSKALENADPQALKIIQQMQQELAAKKSGNGSSTSGTTAASTTDPNAAQRDANIKKLTDSAARGVWNSIKADPIKNLPVAMSMFLKHIGVGGGIADFFENPFAFYGSVLALLLGGGALIGGFGGRSSNQPTVVNNYYGQQQPKGYNIVPYT